MRHAVGNAVRRRGAVDARKLRRLSLVYGLAFSVTGLGLVLLLTRLGVERPLVIFVGVVFVLLATAMAVSVEYNAPKDWTGPR